MCLCDLFESLFASQHKKVHVCVPIIVFLFLWEWCGSFVCVCVFLQLCISLRLVMDTESVHPPLLQLSSCSRFSMVCVLIYSWSSMCRTAAPQLNQILGLAFNLPGFCHHCSPHVRALILRSACAVILWREDEDICEETWQVEQADALLQLWQRRWNPNSWRNLSNLVFSVDVMTKILTQTSSAGRVVVFRFNLQWRSQGPM